MCQLSFALNQGLMFWMIHIKQWNNLNKLYVFSIFLVYECFYEPAIVRPLIALIRFLLGEAKPKKGGP